LAVSLIPKKFSSVLNSQEILDMSSPRSCSVVLLVIVGLAWPSNGKSFMPRQEEVEASLLAELAGTFRASASMDHVVSLEAALRPMYAAVPQEADGRLSQTVVHYVLHRFFAQRGWSIRGLERGNRMGNSSSGELLKEWVPSYLTEFLEKMSGGRGLSLRELAILAATLEGLAHKETIARLEQAFDALELPHSAHLGEEEVSEVLEVFMMMFLYGRDFPAADPEEVWVAHTFLSESMPGWGAKQEWMQTIRKSLYPGAADLDFNAVSRIAEEIGAKFGELNSHSCAAVKNELLEEESQKAGRVRLADFYKKGLDGGDQFTEKIEYLRVSGLLDESDPNQPYVIIPNYVGNHVSCIEASSFYLICCANQCEDLMGKLENAIASEMALPEQIIQLVSLLSSDTVTAPRTLSPMLTGRLHSIAKTNAGQVPLHGRLFAQWMHHAFPRECPFPHEGVNVSPQTPDEWLRESGHETSEASIATMEAHVDGNIDQKPKGAEAREHHSLAENQLYWSEVDEPLLPFGHPARSQPRSTLRTGCMFTMLLSVASGLILATKVLLAGADEQKCLPNLAFGAVNFAKEAGKLV